MESSGLVQVLYSDILSLDAFSLNALSSNAFCSDALSSNALTFYAYNRRLPIKSGECKRTRLIDPLQNQAIGINRRFLIFLLP